MSENKKYYWLKLQKDFFKRHDMKIIENMPNGKDYILFYLKLLLESISHEGSLRFSEAIPYSEEMLSVITDTNIDVVKSAMKIFQELKMIEALEDSTLFMAEVTKMIGCETSVAERVRKYRALHSNIEVTTCNKVKQICNTEIELEKEIELDIEKEIDIGGKEKRKRFVYPSKEDIISYCKESDLSLDADKFIDYYTSNGWMVGKNKMKDWRATVRNWARKEKPEELKKEASNEFEKYGNFI